MGVCTRFHFDVDERCVIDDAVYSHEAHCFACFDFGLLALCIDRKDRGYDDREEMLACSLACEALNASVASLCFS
jgi:hypothetical protein